jgi:muramoyltetrapeptide carboxypeptidase
MPNAGSFLSPLAACVTIAVSPLFAQVQGAPAEWKIAPALRPGDTIALVAPAAPIDLPAVLEVARALEQAGYKVVVPVNLGRKSGYLAGTDEERAGELNSMIRNPKIRAIFACRGGYGLTRIIDKIDYSALCDDPKIITGFSDLTALHLAVARKAHLVSFHAPMSLRNYWPADKEELPFAAQSFRRAICAEQYKKGASGYTIAVPGDAAPVKLNPGKARGRLLGGNLSMICATMGTPYAIEAKGAILFVEDANEAPYRVDRMLSQLRLAGVLNDVAGIVAGSFSSKDASHPKEMERVIREYFSELKVPVILNFPVGHISDNATLPHGALVELDADRPALKVLENPVRTE